MIAGTEIMDVTKGAPLRAHSLTTTPRRDSMTRELRAIIGSAHLPAFEVDATTISQEPGPVFREAEGAGAPVRSSKAPHRPNRRGYELVDLPYGSAAIV